MQPTCIERTVSPIDLIRGRFQGHPKHIAPAVATEEKLIVRIEPQGHLPVHIGEVVVWQVRPRLRTDGIAEQMDRDVQREPPARQHRRYVTRDRALDHRASRDHTERRRAGDVISVAILHRQSQHAREPSAILGRKGPLDEVDIAQRIGVERAEETAEVGRVIDDDAVEQREVLVRRAAAHVESARKLGRGLHPGHQL